MSSPRHFKRQASSLVTYHQSRIFHFPSLMSHTCPPSWSPVDPENILLCTCHVLRLHCRVKCDGQFIVVAISHNYSTNSLVICSSERTGALSLKSLKQSAFIDLTTTKEPRMAVATKQSSRYNSDRARTKKILKPRAK